MKALRIKRGMTLEEVGNIVGVGKSTVRKWESGQIANMRRDKIALVAKALGTTPSYLMGWDDAEATPAPDDDDDVWTLRESLRDDPNRRMLFHLAKNATAKDVEAAASLIDALRATNPDFYDGEDPS